MSAWVFGYGSLVWRPAFAHAERVPAYIDDWKRRFWQASPDHRGTPDAPGRVVTLLPEPGARTWGMAYRIEPGHEQTVLAALDHREKAGYEHHRVSLHLQDGRVLEGGLVYVASATNPNFVGPSHPDDLARLIETRAGPSGPNIEYVLELARALHEMGARDPHVEDLARRVQGIEVRTLRPEEWRLYRTIRLAALKTDPMVFGSSHALEVQRPPEAWRERLEEEAGTILGVFVQGELVGMTGVGVRPSEPTTAVLWGSWLRPDQRRRGLSGPMYEARLAWARARPGIRRVVVSHRASNTASEAANQRHGFQLTHVGERTWRDGKTEAELHYELVLAPDRATRDDSQPAIDTHSGPAAGEDPTPM